MAKSRRNPSTPLPVWISSKFRISLKHKRGKERVGPVAKQGESVCVQRIMGNVQGEKVDLLEGEYGWLGTVEEEGST